MVASRKKSLVLMGAIVGSAMVDQAVRPLLCKTPQHTSILSGNRWVHELLHGMYHEVCCMFLPNPC